MATTPTGLTVPVASDAFDPQGDITRLANSVRGRFHALAANTTARTALAASCGWAPTAADPLVVLQTDTRVLWSYADGASWVSLVPTWPAETGVIAGVNAPAGSRVVTMALSYVGMTSFGGDIVLPIPAGFSGITGVVPCNGDATVTVGWYAVMSTTLTTATVRAFNSSGSVIQSTNVRVNYVVSGWAA